MFNFYYIVLQELLRILFWTCIRALAVSLLALIIAGVYFRHKLVHGFYKNTNSFLQSAIYVWVGVCANLQFAKAYQKSYLKFFVLI